MIRTVALPAVLFAAFALGAQTPVTERYLLPVFTPAVHGAFGSEFHTELHVANRVHVPATMFFVYPDCRVSCPTVGAVPVPPDGELGPSAFQYSGNPGRFVYVMSPAPSALSMNLRVHDVTRDDKSFGVEIPIVREDEFLADTVVLAGVPTDARFRNTLRIYSDDANFVTVTVEGRPPVTVPLTSDFRDRDDPPYAAFTNFPVDAGTVRVTIQGPPLPPIPPFIPSKLWAFITVTNNETQIISTITPQP